MPKADNPAEGGAADLSTYDWAYQGTRGTPQEAGYVALDEPAAETDNDWNYSVREDLKLLNWEIGENESNIAALDTRITDLETRVTDLESGYVDHTHDNRYYTESESNSRFVNVTGDTMSGRLNTTAGLSVNSTTAEGHFHVGASEEIDTRAAVIDADGDAGSNDDALLVRSNPDPTMITDSDSVLAVKPDRVGVNTYNPNTALDVRGQTELHGRTSIAGTLDMESGIIIDVGGSIRFSSSSGNGIDFRGGDGSHNLWKMDNGATTPEEYSARINPSIGNVWEIWNDTTNTKLIRLEDTGELQVTGPLNAGEGDWLTLPTYNTSDPSPPADGYVRMWARSDLA